MVIHFANIFWLRGNVWRKRWLLRLFLYSIPVPWIAAELGWVVAEMGRNLGWLPVFYQPS